MKSIRVAVAAAAAGIALTACSSPMQAGAAAVVGNERISASRLNDETRAYSAALRNAKLPPQLQAALAGRSLEEVLEQESGASTSRRVLRRMVEVSAYNQLIARHNVQVSQAEIDKIIQSPLGPDGTQYPSAELQLLLSEATVAPANAREYGRALAGLIKLRQQFGGQDGEERFKKELNTVKVAYSPRFDTLNPRFGKVTEQQPQQQG
ncbi:hypothetical protein E1292_24095 [Nonomuraea deserti]|uniref:Peptidyl-prolyl cis-trans isomerase SurA n=1 Tax=Nonomuraea deserti TaxID=1848322 RepID=A0A4R4VJ07_9ACTN|nr:hypothetical protein [Nonomuraea deserti]TDD02224.1 hypothetical protein E1292_24095 [Nonomuraea deserti]